MKAKSTHLTEDQMEAVSIHAITGHGVELNQDGSFKLNDKGDVVFRVSPSKLGKEVLGVIGMEVNTYQIQKSVNWFARNSARFKTVINVPAQASVHEDMLKVTISKLETEIATLNKKVEEQKLLIVQSYDKFKKMKEFLR